MLTGLRTDLNASKNEQLMYLQQNHTAATRIVRCVALKIYAKTLRNFIYY